MNNTDSLVVFKEFKTYFNVLLNLKLIVSLLIFQVNFLDLTITITLSLNIKFDLYTKPSYPY